MHAHAESFAEAAQLAVLNPGDVMRTHLREQSPFGLRLDQYIDADELVPSELVLEMMLESLASVKGGWVLANFPRTVTQAESLARHGHAPTAVIELSVTDEQVRGRLRERDERLGQCTEHDSAVMRRLVQHRELAAYYQFKGNLHSVSGQGGSPGFGDYEDVEERLKPVHRHLLAKGHG